MARVKPNAGSSMSDSASSPKRRRTKGSFEMKKKKQVRIEWPPQSLPVEIFQLIIEYLPRSTVQNMRCVNKEFEEKVSAFLFKVVVVPFKPEIYGISPEPTLAGMTDAQTRANEIQQQGAVMLQDKGLRVFQGFGSHIRKFALSFEFDEKKLSTPPMKCDQEAIHAFWGIYRWPFKTYNRYAQLEGLEQTADETRTMAKALRFIGNANELGLSIDGGLGWLAGPDVNQKVVERGGKVSVFGESKFVPEDPPKTSQAKIRIGGAASSSVSHGQGREPEQLRRMLQASGHEGVVLEEALAMMRELENTEYHPFARDPSIERPRSTTSSTPTSSTTENLNPLNTIANRATTALAARHGPPSPNNLPLDGQLITAGDENQMEILSLDSETDEESEAATPAADSTSVSKPAKKHEACPLKPNELTIPQREMLLEIEWAQRAFMQSYAIAIIDNPVTFEHIKTLTIARIPNRHLPILRRDDFWNGLPQLKTFSLAVIPDWRDVVKLPTSWVQDIRLAPSQSVRGVFQLLQDQISRRKSIKTLHFEWIGGGEDAPGLFARNHQILAAPLVSKALDMVNRSNEIQVLTLPHIEHLSLKNCWVSPHILTRFCLAMRKDGLQSFLFDSVSLTASLPLNAQPGPMANNAVNQGQVAAAHAHQVFANIHGLAGPNGLAPVPGLLAPPSTTHSAPAWLSPPRTGSWADFIDTFTPGNTIAQIRYARDDDVHEPEPRDPGTIDRLDFKSCGYIRLPLDFDQTALDPPTPPVAQAQAISKRISDLESHMMRPHEYTMGVIVNHIAEIETQTLVNAFQMSVGWDQSRSVLAAESALDGIANAGQGRFDGFIWQPRAATLASSSFSPS